MATVTGTQLATAREKLLSSLPEKHVAPLWTVLRDVTPPRPNPKATPALWKYDEIRPYLLEAGNIVSDKEAERRVLMLINPSLRSPYTTDTLYAGLQLVLPQETAPAHRHTAFALRYIIEGERGFTAVEGERMIMKKGDMILTPSWQWHDHGHEGEGPLIWLDGLDLPMYQHFPTNFLEEYELDRFPSEIYPNSPLQFPWEGVKKDLDIQTGPYAMHFYKSPTGGEISPTLGAQAEKIRSGTSSPSKRETCSFVYHVASGRGHSRLIMPDGKVEVIQWKENDTFAIPTWTRIQHSCTSSEDGYLFAFSDRAAVVGLGMYRRD